MTLPSDAEQSTKRQLPREQSQPGLSASSSCAAGTPMHVPEPSGPKPARQMSPAEREDNMLKRERPSEVNTVLMIAGVYNGNEIASWTEEHKSTTHCKATRPSQH